MSTDQTQCPVTGETPKQEEQQERNAPPGLDEVIDRVYDAVAKMYAACLDPEESKKFEELGHDSELHRIVKMAFLGGVTYSVSMPMTHVVREYEAVQAAMHKAMEEAMEGKMEEAVAKMRARLEKRDDEVPEGGEHAK